VAWGVCAGGIERKNKCRWKEGLRTMRLPPPLERNHREGGDFGGSSPDADTLALYIHPALRDHRQEDVGELSVEQVDVVDVEHTAVRLGEEAGLENRLALQKWSGNLLHSYHQAAARKSRANLREISPLRVVTHRATHSKGHRNIL
jgi:hypothetical protein